MTTLPVLVATGEEERGRRSWYHHRFCVLLGGEAIGLPAHGLFPQVKVTQRATTPLEHAVGFLQILILSVNTSRGWESLPVESSEKMSIGEGGCKYDPWIPEGGGGVDFSPCFGSIFTMPFPTV